jgi:hypothetical protein
VLEVVDAVAETERGHRLRTLPVRLAATTTAPAADDSERTSQTLVPSIASGTRDAMLATAST